MTLTCNTSHVTQTEGEVLQYLISYSEEMQLSVAWGWGGFPWEQSFFFLFQMDKGKKNLLR